ncbi:hypothetical protein DUI87_14703 [Hirundo rustica rustica]|uniref:Uncharacterized protein n=1 Tax=Hirundo rustica rustica TaxID=333673 RepID=A0A3M0K5I5_HIRRU|nr:hypothetical protein DUI87_14703 [Hirundo rustica rustica]
MVSNPFSEKNPPDIQPESSLAQLKAMPSCPVTVCLGEEAKPHLATPSLQAVVENGKFPPEPSPLQTKAWLPQPLLTGLSLQTLPQLHCPSLDSLQPLSVLPEVMGPQLDTALEVWPHQCRVQGDNPCPDPAGRTTADPGQDAAGLLGPLGHAGSCTAAVDQHPRSFSTGQLSRHSSPANSAAGVVVSQVQDPALHHIKPYTIGLSPSIQPGQIPLQSLPVLQQINTPIQLGSLLQTYWGGTLSP